MVAQYVKVTKYICTIALKHASKDSIAEPKSVFIPGFVFMFLQQRGIRPAFSGSQGDEDVVAPSSPSGKRNGGLCDISLLPVVLSSLFCYHPRRCPYS